MSDILYYRRSNGDEVSVEVGSALHDRLSVDGEYTLITEFGGDPVPPEEEPEFEPTLGEPEETETVDLPIVGFDEMTVEEVVPHLEDLDAEDLSVIEAYEIANKNRTTLLEAIEAARSED
jgi:hypothetical protein